MSSKVDQLKIERNKAYDELKRIPWWHFREQSAAARKYNRLRSAYLVEVWNRRPMIKTITIVFTNGGEKKVMGYHHWVTEEGLLKIQTSDRQGGPESYEYYPINNIQQWSV